MTEPVDTPPPAETPPPPAPKWHEDARWGEHRDWLTAKGALVDDPVEALDKAVRAAHGAEKFLGRRPDTLMTKPAEGQALAEWMRQNAGVFGLPEAPDKYAIERPQMAAGVEWDEGLETAARTLAHEHGVPAPALQAIVGLYAQHLGAKVEALASESDAARTTAMAELQKAWGPQTAGKIAQAKIAAQTLATKAGLGAEGQALLMSALSDAGGDPFAIRAMAALAEMMGEDGLVNPAGGGGGVATTPAEAKARLAAMDAPDGPYGKAYRAGDRREMARLEPERSALMRLAAGV